MTSSFRLGRVAGIEIGVNWSWVIIFALVTFSLAVSVFPDQNPGLSDGTYWAMAGVAAVLFFASILLHELGHALQARRDEVEIEGITLWLLGGVAKFKSMYKTAGAEFRIAIAGPLVTAAIAGILVVLRLLELPTAVDGVAFWLAFINVLVLVFNLLPALPLDGGRVLHSILWHVKGDILPATRIAAGIGQGFGFVLVGMGILALLTGLFLPGVWFLILGWFLNAAARGEAAHIAAREALGGLRVRDLMAEEPVTVHPDVTLGQFVDAIARHTRYTTYPVVEGGRPVGLLTFRCVADVPREQWDERRVAECMVPLARVPTVEPDDDAAEALAEVSGGGVNRALVVDRERLAGLLSISDLARAVEIGRSRNGARRRTTSRPHA